MPRTPTILIAAPDSPAASVASAPAPDGRAATKARHPSNVIPLHRGIAPPLDYDARPQSADTPLVAFFRRHQHDIAVACFAIATAVGVFFAWQVGRGAL